MPSTGSEDLRARVCPTCTAPLDAPDTRGMARCRYCNSVVESPAQRRRDEPANHFHIVIEAPAAHFPSQPAGRSRAILAVLPGVVTLGVVALVLYGSFSSSGMLGARSVTSLPVVCAPNEHLFIKNVTYAGTGVAVQAGINCEIAIERSSIQAGTVIKGDTNLKIVIKDSKLTGTDAAIDLGTNGALDVSGTSEIAATTTAIIGSLNPEVRLANTNVHGGVSAIALDQNAKLHVAGGEFRGAKAIDLGSNAKVDFTQTAHVVGVASGVHVGSNAQVTMNTATIEATGTALEVGDNATLDLTATSLTGAAAALSISRTPSSQTVTGCTFKGPHLVGGRDVEAARPATHALPTPPPAPTAAHPRTVPHTAR